MLKPVHRQTLPQTILDRMVTAVKDGEWQPGSKIPCEQELADLFGVSRNSIRESVKILNSMGILTSHPGLGTFLSPDAIQQIVYLDFLEKGKNEEDGILDLVEIRILLESQCTYWAAKRTTEKDRRQLKNLLTKSQKLAKDDLRAHNLLHTEFHNAMIAMSKNSFAIRLFSLLEAEIESQRSKYDEMPVATQVDMIQDQEEILKHILAREPEDARRAMERHLQKGLQLLTEALSEKQE